MKISFSFLLCFAIFIATKSPAQSVGVALIGESNIGITYLAKTSIGKTNTPVCTFPTDCNSACAVYVFEGNGNWSDANNWRMGLVPPRWLNTCMTIMINPSGDGECVLDVQQQLIPAKGTVIVQEGKRFLVPKNIDVKQQ